jgi:hypothetical protein
MCTFWMDTIKVLARRHCKSSSSGHSGPLCLEIPWCYRQFFWYWYFAGIRFNWAVGILVGITSLAGSPFFRKRGAGYIERGPLPPFSLKKGTSAPFLREKGVPAKKKIPKCTDRDFLWYRYGKYQDIPTDTNDRKIPIRYTTLVMSKKNATIFRYDFVVGGHIVPKTCLHDRIEKNGWDGRQGQKG